MKSNPPNVPPVLARDTVAVVADGFNVVYGFSSTTGKQLWEKDLATSVLASDGHYFYVVRTAYWKLIALDPTTGQVVWSLQLPDMGPGYLRFLPVQDGFLFVGDFVVDTSKKAIVHEWPYEPFYIDTLAFDNDGNILGGGTSGLIVMYDHDLRPLQTFSVGKGNVVQVAPAGEQTLAMVDNYDTGRSRLVSLTHHGNRLWQVRWPSRSHAFAVIGQNVLTLEPGENNGRSRLVSRHLLTGKINWATSFGYFGGRPILCANTVYVDDGEQLRGFDVHTGAEAIPKN